MFAWMSVKHVLNIRDRETGVSVCGPLVRISIHICGRKRERLTDSNGKVRSRRSAKLAVLATTPEEVLDCPLCSCREESLPPPTHSCTYSHSHGPLPLDSTGLETSCSLDQMNKHSFTYACTLWIHRSREWLHIVLSQTDLFCASDKGEWNQRLDIFVIIADHIGV